MARAKQQDAISVEELNMTPMIDVVFQLIIFFMFTTEMSNLQAERIQIPWASRAQKQEERAREEVWRTINIVQDGTIKVNGTIFTPEQLQEFLAIEAEGAGREAPNPTDPAMSPSMLQVLIRADRDARYDAVTKVIEACMNNGVYRTSVAASPDEPH